MTAAGRSRRPLGLAARIAALGIGVAVITGVLAGVLAVGLIGDATATSARAELSRLADVAARVSDTTGAQQRILRTLGAIEVQFGHVGPGREVVDSPWPVVRAAIDADQLAQLRAGEAVSASESVRGVGVYVEARPMPGGGAVVLVQQHGDAGALGSRATRRTMVAILVGVAVAAIVAAVVARRIARPLRRTAQAAHALAAGRRDVVVRPDGPAEVAEVAGAVNLLAGALARSEARQREFLLSVSHDLRTPLTAITGYAESLADGVVPPAEAPAAAAVMVAEARRLTRLVSDLLDLARLDAHEFRIEAADVDVTGLAHETARVWRNRCEAAGVRFALEAPAGPLWVHTDAARLRQVLDGLFDNALRVTPSGAPIVLSVRAETDAVLAEVRDGGPGLSDDDLAVAFERAELYQRYRGVRQVGTGLGLAIVARLTARLGGAVSAGHAPEGGARFTVRLPRLLR